MASRQKIFSGIIICIIIINTMIVIALLPGDEASAWEFGGLKLPKTSIEYAVGESPQSVYVQDINNDTHPDIITADRGGNGVTVLLGDGKGYFQTTPGSPYPVGSEPWSVFVADINNDTHPDILTANSEEFTGNGFVIILLGDGEGNFSDAPNSPFSVGRNPMDVAVADINKDTNPDIVTADSGGDNVTVLIGDGTGDFSVAPNSPFSTGLEPVSVFIADVNNDLDPDIVTANLVGDSVSVLLGDGQGSFDGIASDLAVHDMPFDVFVADIDNDSNLDIMTVNANSEDVTVLLGDGTGESFTEVENSPFPVGETPFGFFAADVNGDENVDIITANSGSDNVSILHGDGTGDFHKTPVSSFPVGDGPSSVFLKDIDGDEFLDIITANTYSNDVSVLLGRGYGYFFTPDNTRLNFYEIDGSPLSTGMAAESVFATGSDQDGYQYIFTADFMSVYISVFYRNGNEVFSQKIINLDAGDNPYCVFSEDVNGDGLSDILATTLFTSKIYVILGQGMGSFSEPLSFLSGGLYPVSLYVADLNLDDDPDIVTANLYGNDVRVFLGHGNGQFTAAQNSPFPVGKEPFSVSVADVNGDHNPDIITANRGNDTVSVLFGNGDADFDIVSRSDLTVTGSPHDVSAADTNDDGNMDIITVNRETNDVKVLYGSGEGNFTQENSFPVGKGPSRLSLMDMNYDGNLDIITLNHLSNDVTILLGEGNGNFTESFHGSMVVDSSPGGLSVRDVTGDSLPNIITTSKDNSILQIHDVFIDFDYDGVPDNFDDLPTNPTEWRDSDHDQIGNNSDEDDDNDGTPDMTDPFPLNSSAWSDLDGDGFADNFDNDIDGDEYDNLEDTFPFNSSEWNDTDEDGIGDNSDDDIDGDGVPNYVEGLKQDKDNNNNGIYDVGEYDEFEFDILEWVNTDGLPDGGNREDPDDDNDGYNDTDDAFPLDETEWKDTDGDGKGDNTDPDTDGDGVPNIAIGLIRDFDNNNDGIYDDGIEYDELNLTASEWVDTDKDGTGNNADQDDDDDGYKDTRDAFPLDASEWNDTDEDGIGDNSDDDIDGDGFPNDEDAFPYDPTEWSDIDGDGIGDNKDPDIDGDGHDNEEDAYPWDPSRYEEKEEFLGYKWNISNYNKWLYRMLYSTIFLSFYSLLSTGYLYIMKRGIFLTGLFVFQKARKVPYYKKEIRRADSIPTLEHIFDKVEDDKSRHHIDMEQYDLIRQEADKKRVALTYAVLSSLSPDQQMMIFNDVILRDEKMKAQIEEAVRVKEGRSKEPMGGVGEGDGEGQGAGLGVAGVGAKTADVSGKNVDNVHFTVTSPPKVKSKSSFVVDLWAHLEEQQRMVIEQARLMAIEEELTIRSVGPKPIARGTILTAKLQIEDMVIEHPTQTILWEGEIGNANFAAKVPEGTDIGSKQGTASIFIDGLRIAMIHFLIHVTEEAEELEKAIVERIPLTEHRIETAFASYARLDRDEVLPRIQGIQKALPSLSIFLDILSLRSGQNWESEIKKIIPAKDIFYLFWSENAKKSHWVEVEWRCALDTRGVDFIDPVPLISPEVVPPPQELAEKHFDDWTLAFMNSERFNIPKQKPDS